MPDSEDHRRARPVREQPGSPEDVMHASGGEARRHGPGPEAQRVPLVDTADSAHRAPPPRTPAEIDAAFAPLLAHDKRLVNLAYRLLGDRDEAMDAVQDAYLQAYRAFRSFRGDAQPFTWLCRITLNECARRGRKRRTRRGREVDLEVLREKGVEPAAEDPEHVSVDRGVTLGALRQAVDDLPSPYRE